MTTLREAAQQALEALSCIEYGMCGITEGPANDTTMAAMDALRAALAQEQAEPVAGIIESEIREDIHQTLDAAMQQPRAMAQAYENGYKAGAAAERERILSMLDEMQRQAGDRHNYYAVAANRIREGV